MIRLVIFDLDGVIIDSEVKNKERLFSFLSQYVPGITVEEVYKTAGFGNKETKAYIHQVTGMDPDEGYECYNRFKKTYQGITDYREIINHDAVDLLEHLKNNGYLLALATSTSRPKLSVKIGEEILQYFDTVITRDDVTKSKPDPEMFLKACENLGIPVNECVVIEDSTVGIEAGKRAGMKVIARKNRKLPVDTSQADLAVYDLMEGIETIKEEM